VLHAAWKRRVNTPTSSAVGRLFDAAAALTGLNHRSSYEGQGPMLLEAACAEQADPTRLPLVCDANGIWRSDWTPLIRDLLTADAPVGIRARQFHASLAQALADQAMRIREVAGDFAVGLAGGVFQNNVLTTEVLTRLGRFGFDVRLPRVVPTNDAAISYGQIVEVGFAGPLQD